MNNFSKIEIKVWTGHYEEIKSMAHKLIYYGTIPNSKMNTQYIHANITH